MSNSKSVQQTVAREGPLVRGVSRPVVGASKQQTAIVIPDASSSMAGTKIDEVNAATMALVTELAGPKCRDAFSVGLVYFNSTADTLLAPKKATALSPADVAVPQNLVGGMTNITAGLEVALALVNQLPAGELRPICVLMTDGGHNEGPTPDATATRLKAKADLLCVAFGADADMALLQRLATTPGHALRVATGADLRTWFATIGTTMATASRTGQTAAALLGGGGVVRG